MTSAKASTQISDANTSATASEQISDNLQLFSHVFVGIPADLSSGVGGDSSLCSFCGFLKVPLVWASATIFLGSRNCFPGCDNAFAL